MQKLHGSTRAYPWGSRSLISGLRGEPATEKPEAEIWYGAHPAAPATLGVGEEARGLDDVIATDPVHYLGRDVAGAFHGELPFLLKILAADEPLSLQAHPSSAIAREGFERENAAGIALSAPNRNYKDPNHKPELIVALTEFDAMAGFRPLDKTRELFALLNCPELDRYLTMLEENPACESANLRALFTTWITIPGTVRHELIDALITAAQPHRHRSDWMGFCLNNIIQLNERYPGDVGVLGALLLNHVRLQPGEAIYLAACHLHAYIRGLGVEIMANSDNVLRGGLTSKYVDVPELVKVLDFHSMADPIVARDGTNPHQEYPVPATEYRLFRHLLQPGEELTIDFPGPVIALCIHGTISLGDQEIQPTESLWISASDPAVQAKNTAGDTVAELFIATT